MKRARPPSGRLEATLAAALVLACSSSAPPRVPKLEDYDRSCQVDGDCRPLFIGSGTCCDFTCPNAAVNAAVSDRATTDTWRASTCRIGDVCQELLPCPGSEAICVAGQCEIRPHPSKLSLDDYDRSCAAVTDCALVFFEEVPCGSPRCPNAAVRASEAGRLNGDVNNALLTSMMWSCNVTPPRQACTGRVSCTNGLCQFLDEPHDAGVPRDSGAPPDAAADGPPAD
ncbi:MAG TPA: hypothetical protein VHK47_03385 [Polyangia bacterium]|jgi:hypothetical protein|nr:hypothetical protein [Polyangia bacterium]